MIARSRQPMTAEARRLELEPNPFYWRTGFPRSDGLVFSFGVPSGEAVSRLRAGQCSIAVNPNPADAEPLWSDPAFAAASRSVPMLSTYVLLFNTHRGPFADPVVRRAVTAAEYARTLMMAGFEEVPKADAQGSTSQGIRPSSVFAA